MVTDKLIHVYVLNDKHFVFDGVRTVYTQYIVVVQLGVTVSYKVMFFLSTIKQQQMLSP